MRLDTMQRQRRRMHLAACTMWIPCIGSLLVAQDEAATPREQGQEARVAWKYAPAGSSFEEVVADNGVVFALDRSGKIHALDARSGDKLWTSDGKREFSFGFGIALSSNPGFEALLVSCDTGLLALDRKTGKQLWHTEIPAGVAGPACTDQAVIAGSADGKVYACELETGKILWQHDYLEDRPDDPPGFAGDQARFGGKPARPGEATTDGKMVVLPVFDQCRALALDAVTGKRLWTFQTQGWTYGRCAIGPRNVYVVSQDKHCYAVDKEIGKLAWQVETRARNEAPATPTERFVYFGSCDADLYAVDQAVGRVAWKFATEHEKGHGAPIYSAPLVIGDNVYLAAMKGTVYALQRHNGELLWQLCPLPKSELNSDLVVDGTRLFVTTRKSGDEGESAVLAIDMQ